MRNALIMNDKKDLKLFLKWAAGFSPAVRSSLASVDETLVALCARGVTITHAPFDVPVAGLRLGFVTDPHGNELEFLQRLG